MHQWTKRTTARAELAEALRDRHLDRAQAAGIAKAELDEISFQGRKAEEADRVQKKQMATIAAERGAQKDLKVDVFAREDELRDRLPAVIRELWGMGDRHHARWLSSLSYARYRFREIKPADVREAPEGTEPCATDDKETRVLRAVQRVVKADAPTRAAGLAAFCQALLDPEGEVILKRLAERDFPPEALRKLAEDAQTLANMGKNVLRAAEATAEEAEAARAQLEAWQSVRRMVRKAVQGEPELERKWAEC